MVLLLRALSNHYCEALKRAPVRVKALTSGAAFGTTDALAQARESAAPSDDQQQQQQQHDATRMLVAASYGALYQAPLNHFAWNVLERRFPGTSWAAVMSRVAVDQLTLMPVNMVFFLSWRPMSTALLSALDEARSLDEVRRIFTDGLAAAEANVRAAWAPACTFALSIWPWVHPINFRYVPLEHRLLVTNVCSVFIFSFATWVRDEKDNPDVIEAPVKVALRRTITSQAN